MLARKNILKIKPYIPGKPIEEVKRQLGLKKVIKLASNENALRPSGAVIRAARRAVLSANRYPDGGCFYLKKELSKRFKVKPGRIIIGNGSDEIIILAVKAFLAKGEEVIIAKQTFLIYEIASQIGEAKIRYAPLKNYRYDIDAIIRLITDKTKMIFIANPDNPAGTYLGKREIERLVRSAPRDTILYFDEAYFEFAKNMKDFPDTMKYLGRKNVIVTRTFSKAYSLAGLRIGYGFSSENIIECLNRVREPFNVNSVAQEAAIAALCDKAYLDKTLKLVQNGKAYLYEKLGSLGIKYVPSATNFILIDVGMNSKTVFKRLLKRGIIVREMSPWKLKNFIRVTIGTVKENRVFIKALKEILQK
ncbi:MAG: histidinol-phosphate transaminase [Candidatus Omnitrophica bacterium]|nr:histidinol-phosphate transaminase [Candidatus Omnitrophota bacterium]